MSSILSWFKKELEFLKDSFPLIIKAFALFLLSFSGFGVSIILRMIGYNGVIISLGGIIIEGIAMIILFFFLNYSYFQEEDKKKQISGKKK